MAYSNLDKGSFTPGPPLVWEFGALWVENFRKGLKGRTLHGRPYALYGENREVQLVPADQDGVHLNDNVLTLRLTPALAKGMVSSLQPQRGDYRWPQLPGFIIRIVPTEVKGPKGEIETVVG
jgi:hypothetical protein